MPTSAEWLVFLGAATLLAIIPGPGMLYVLARSLRGGRADGIRSVLGNCVGALGHVAAAAVGLSALLAASASAFTVVKLLGAAYLIYLGVRALLDRNRPHPEESPVRRRADTSAFVQGIVTEALNPKTALFFLAFLPHFVHPEAAPAPLVFALLGVIAVAMAMAMDLLVAVFAGGLGARLTGRWRGRQRLASGVTMIGLGGALALAERG